MINSVTPLRAALALVLASGALGTAHATNGYFPHGFGIKAQGMGGAAIATANDAFAGVNNPAAATFADNQWELGGALFSPKRSMTRTDPSGMLQGAFVANETSGRNQFLIPEFGYNRKLSGTTAVGLAVYGNGGMNTSYTGASTVCPTGMTTPPAMGMNAMCGQGKLGVDLMQLIVAPTFAYKATPEHSLGVSPLLVLQRFEAYGLQGFAPMSSNSKALTNNGKDSSTGVGIRLGYMGKLSDKVSVGATYSPKISMSRLDKYAGLFAEQGKFDIPARRVPDQPNRPAGHRLHTHQLQQGAFHRQPGQPDGPHGGIERRWLWLARCGDPESGGAVENERQNHPALWRQPGNQPGDQWQPHTQHSGARCDANALDHGGQLRPVENL